jgi:2-dehydro-3-deoxyglucarate aldolase/4-hydroxy-2-oxoheptanedioate aldolase
MFTNRVKQALREGKVQLGTNFSHIASPEIVRILAAAGFHWAFVDTEHGVFNPESLFQICKTSQLVGFTPILRVTSLEYDLVARALDLGAHGVIFPRVEEPGLLEQAVSWTKFPPLGIRGYGLVGPHLDYEKVTIPQGIEQMNRETLVVLQIETKKALEARDELLSIPGIDAVMVGPADLSISLGVPGEFQHPKMVEAMEAIRDSCVARGIFPGTQTRTVELAQFWKERGMKFLGCSGETTMRYDRAVQISSALGPF